jgi:hypothetical protein
MLNVIVKHHHFFDNISTHKLSIWIFINNFLPIVNSILTFCSWLFAILCREVKLKYMDFRQKSALCHSRKVFDQIVEFRPYFVSFIKIIIHKLRLYMKFRFRLQANVLWKYCEGCERVSITASLYNYSSATKRIYMVCTHHQ